MRFLAVALLLVGGLAWCEEWTWVDEAGGDPATLVEKVRAFDRLHRDLAEEIIVAYRKVAGTPASEEKAKDLLDQAGAHIALIREAYERAAALQPNNAALLNYRGEFLYDVMGDEAEGVRLWRRAVELDDTLAPAHNNLGIHYFHSGNYEEGLKELDRALKLDREHPDFLFNMAQMYLIHTPQVMELRHWSEKKIYREAMKLSRKAVKQAPDDYALARDYAMNFFSAERFGVKPDWERAAEAWAAARACAPAETDVFYTWLNQGRVLVAAREDEKAVKCLEQALAIKADSTAATDLLAGARKRIADRDK